jgi:peptidyl-prolyl cis-trans isomerase B (cyclophilin B)
MAERAANATRRRKRGTVVLGVAAVVVVLGLVIWLVAAGGGGKKAPAAAASASNSVSPTSCTWKPNPDPSPSPSPTASQAPNPNLKNVGTPPATGEPRSGTRDMTINTNLGTIVVRLDLAKAPCTGASFTYLAGKHFFDNTSCHRLVNSSGADAQTGEPKDFHVLQCGDPTGTGQGGPTYEFDNEYVPTDQRPAYPAGVVAMANSGPNTNGSQFFIVYADTLLAADYTIFGSVVKGLDIAKQVGAAGDDEAFASAAGGGHPKKQLTFNTVTVGPVQASAPPVASPSPTPSASHS